MPFTSSSDVSEIFLTAGLSQLVVHIEKNWIFSTIGENIL
jgi:hypothetical protein